MTANITRLDAHTWKVEVSTWMVKIDADENLECSDNAFDLCPGESKSVIVSTDADYPTLKLRVENINKG